MRFGRRNRGGGGTPANPLTAPFASQGLVSVTDTETATIAAGKSVTLSPPLVPLFIETSATGTTGRYTLQNSDGTKTDYNCIPNAPPSIKPIPRQFASGKAVSAVVFSVITVDGVGTILATIWGRPAGG